MDTRELLLTRSGLVFVEGSGGAASRHTVRALEAELADLGFALSTRLARRIAELPSAELTRLHGWLCGALARSLGAHVKHTPLFRSFPDGVPADTFDLYLRKVLVHFLGGAGQPCPLCAKSGTVHVLSPCHHAVCDACFDGASYSACPVCEHAVDRASPFFQPSQERGLPAERVRFKLLDLGQDLDAAARALFEALLARKQALSPTDRDALSVLLADYSMRVVAWLPETIPVRENVALVFGTLLRHAPPDAVLEVAARYLSTATDVLRLIAAYSGADPALQREAMVVNVSLAAQLDRWAGRVLELLGLRARSAIVKTQVSLRVRRFKVAKLSRGLRRALLGFLESRHRDALCEDMLRHRSYWVWVGEFLHPHEHAKRFPKVAHAFQLVRRKDPEGRRAPKFHGWKSRVEAALRERDPLGALTLLEQRPGELARRVDHALRLCGSAEVVDAVAAAFARHAPGFSTPVLLTLRNHFQHRGAHELRVFWPKAAISRGVSKPDTRPLLTPEIISKMTQLVENELLRRFASKPAWDTCVIDDALAQVVAPFNERTASRAAVNLPRGSRLQLPTGKLVRLFVHWCQPEGGLTTDVDLSVGFYDANWKYTGVCSFYLLELAAGGRVIARSSGDLRSAPWPDGASEFVDVDCDAARASGVRWAVMVVNNYAGLAFSSLERGFAGYMLRDDAGGQHFDPRTVEHRFALAGENGTYVPLAIDLENGTLHWIDTYAKGQLAFNNVANANRDIQRLCPERIAYFGSGIRMSMRELSLLHAAARARRVILRGRTCRAYERRDGETAAAFLARLGGTPDAEVDATSLAPQFAALFRDDLELPPGATCYALFRERGTPTIAAADLIA